MAIVSISVWDISDVFSFISLILELVEGFCATLVEVLVGKLVGISELIVTIVGVFVISGMGCELVGELVCSLVGVLVGALVWTAVVALIVAIVRVLLCAIVGVLVAKFVEVLVAKLVGSLKEDLGKSDNKGVLYKRWVYSDQRASGLCWYDDRRVCGWTDYRVATEVTV